MEDRYCCERFFCDGCEAKSFGVVISDNDDGGDACFCVENVHANTTKGNIFPIGCTACSCNQGDNQRTTITTPRRAVHTTTTTTTTHEINNYGFISKTMKRIPLWSTLALIWMSLSVGVTEGLQCYECLSLYCDSGAVCDAIKSTMVEIFVPKRHFIHFDPTDICPENELPGNSQRWANLSRSCERSDSQCLVAPIEVHTVVDMKKNGKKMENEHTLMTYGYLRGCASRRKLLEYPETINVRVEFAGRNESGNKGSSGGGGGSGAGGNSKSNNGVSNSIANNHSNNNDGARGNSNYVNGNKKSEIFYNMTNIGNGAEFDPSKKTYKDGYTIMKIYSHVFYIDQSAKNATRCYEDNCNDKAKFKFKINGAVGFKMLTRSTFVAHFILIGTLFSILCFL